MAVFLHMCKHESKGHVSDLFELWIPILALITLLALGERLTAEQGEHENRSCAIEGVTSLSVGPGA